MIVSLQPATQDGHGSGGLLCQQVSGNGGNCCGTNTGYFTGIDNDQGLTEQGHKSLIGVDAHFMI